ncbi:MAG: hypothetical protein A2583_03980 [Bdellovibrionales bacterium RIFOXYD1_FULL_53_11]|nr:MAG: hypothetical protein A2583_03980 [Bdellovibrionales bacterium RIFOXYD1_FULL_53_11]
MKNKKSTKKPAIEANSILEKIKLGEDTSLELKEVVFRGDKIEGPRRDELADEIAAIANTTNATVVLGVNDKTRAITGIEKQNLDTVEQYVRDICNDSIKPPVYIRMYKERLAGSNGTNKIILRIEIPKSLYVHKSPGGYFYRQGSSRRELVPDLLARLFQQRSQVRLMRFEEQAVPGTSYSSFDKELAGRFSSPEQDDIIVTLQKRNLLAQENGNKEYAASVAGVLMCTRNPDRYLPNAYIECVRYKGMEQDSNYQIDAIQAKGPLDRQIEEAMVFFRRNNQTRAVKNPDRKEFPQFSERAVFEAVVNAVVHRDYSVYGSKIRFFIFNDRLEIYSPGALPNTLTIDSLALRQATRNELISGLLAFCPMNDTTINNVRRKHYLEKRGDGIPIIMKESKDVSGKKPQYRLIDNAELMLTIYGA